MKRLNLLILSMMLVLTTGVLFACGKGEKEVKSVALQGIGQTYIVSDTISFASAKLNVTYADDTTAVLTKGLVDGTLEDLNAEGSDYDFLLLTSGLSAQTAGTYQVGSYKISCYLAGNDKKYDLPTITIYSSAEAEEYDLAIFTSPQFVQDHETYLARAGAAADSEGYEASFMKKDAQYVVGDDNEFIFEPQARVIAKDHSSVVPVSRKIKVNERVELVEGENYTKVGAEYYTFNPATYGFDFTEKAIGKTFQITMTPASWDEYVTGGNIEPIRFKFVVQDGWNASKALDLGRLNLLDNEQSIADFGTYKTSVRNVFWLGLGQPGADNSGHGNIKYYELWKDYLTERGETNLKEINGLYLHGNIKVTKADLPEEYFVCQDEIASATDKEYVLGSLRDFSFLYSHMMTNDFNFNGNLFTVDFSELPVNRTDAGDTFKYLAKGGELTATGGHSTAFAFVNKDIADSDDKKVATIKNVNGVGNKNVSLGGRQFDDLTEQEQKTEKEQYAQDASRALMFVKSLYGVTKAENTITKEFMIAWYPESELGNKALELSDSKIYDCAQCGVFCFSTNNNTMTNCDLKRFGGPAIFLISQSNDDSTEKAWAGLTATDCTIESFVDGTEGWFTVNEGSSALANTIKSMFDGAVENNGVTFLKDVDGTEKLNLQILCLDNKYLGSSKNAIHCNFINNVTGGDQFTFNTVDDFKETKEDLAASHLTIDPPLLKFKPVGEEASIKLLIPSITLTQDPLKPINPDLEKPGYLIDPDNAGQVVATLATGSTDFSDLIYKGTLTGDKVGVHYRHNGACVGVILGLYPEEAPAA